MNQLNQSSLRRFQGLTDVEGAKQIAKRLFNQFSKDQNEITEMQCIPMLNVAYQASEEQFVPKDQDIKGYFGVLDGNKDGRVTYSDVEALCIRYLCGGTSSQYSYNQPPQQSVYSVTQTSNQVNSLYVPPQQSVNMRQAQSIMQNTQQAAVERHLDVARRLFNQFDKDGSGQLEEQEVYELLQQTYINIGMNNIVLTKEDVQSWIEMNDSDKDGKVSLEEYEIVVLRSLQKAGFDIDSTSQHIVFK